MPYKNKVVQKRYLEEWREGKEEEFRLYKKVWRQKNPERNREIDRKSKDKNKDFYNAVYRLQRKLDKEDLK